MNATYFTHTAGAFDASSTLLCEVPDGFSITEVAAQTTDGQQTIGAARVRNGVAALSLTGVDAFTDGNGAHPGDHVQLRGWSSAQQEEVALVARNIRQVGPMASASDALVFAPGALQRVTVEPPAARVPVFDGNFPNPFRDQTTLRYTLPMRTAVTLEVFNAVGQRVALLRDEEQAAGTHEVEVDGSTWASGWYMCRLKADGQHATHAITLVRFVRRRGQIGGAPRAKDLPC